MSNSIDVQAGSTPETTKPRLQRRAVATRATILAGAAKVIGRQRIQCREHQRRDRLRRPHQRRSVPPLPVQAVHFRTSSLTAGHSPLR